MRSIGDLGRNALWRSMCPVDERVICAHQRANGAHAPWDAHHKTDHNNQEATKAMTLLPRFGGESCVVWAESSV